MKCAKVIIVGFFFLLFPPGFSTSSGIQAHSRNKSVSLEWNVSVQDLLPEEVVTDVNEE